MPVTFTPHVPYRVERCDECDRPGEVMLPGAGPADATGARGDLILCKRCAAKRERKR